MPTTPESASPPTTAKAGTLRSAGEFPAGFREYLEYRAAGHPVGLQQLDRHPVGQAIDPAATAADQTVQRLFVGVIIVGQARYRHDAVRAGLVQPDEQAEAGDAADPAAEGRADPLGQISGGEAVDRFALGFGGAPFGR